MEKGIVYDAENREFTVKYFNDSYEFIKENVDGYIEHIPTPLFDERMIDMWCNEEGKFRSDLSPSVMLSYNGKIYDVVLGNLVFTKTDGNGGTIGLSDDDVKYIEQAFSKMENVLTSIGVLPIIEI